MESWKAVNRDNLGEHHTFKADNYEQAKMWTMTHLNPRIDWCVYNITPEEEIVNCCTECGFEFERNELRDWGGRDVCGDCDDALTHELHKLQEHNW